MCFSLNLAHPVIMAWLPSKQQPRKNALAVLGLTFICLRRNKADLSIALKKDHQFYDFFPKLPQGEKTSELSLT